MTSFRDGFNATMNKEAGGVSEAAKKKVRERILKGKYKDLALKHSLLSLSAPAVGAAMGGILGAVQPTDESSRKANVIKGALSLGLTGAVLGTAPVVLTHGAHNPVFSAATRAKLKPWADAATGMLEQPIAPMTLIGAGLGALGGGLSSLASGGEFGEGVEVGAGLGMTGGMLGGFSAGALRGMRNNNSQSWADKILGITNRFAPKPPSTINSVIDIIPVNLLQ